ncbi:hypothetical protein E1B28_011710 [Marasmius oreades]|uniref:Uncharacterized protein n=1 Tax=Marasmius oreades TaxID=181124 RepID=A0A9P7UQ86_9AGAR|nr:uncharacterized protein E1B28_011710 [Marasmius oreades]KAG7090093.1 hypothetical protein E1B28_011710 [Marasmius oreades]
MPKKVQDNCEQRQQKLQVTKLYKTGRQGKSSLSINDDALALKTFEIPSSYNGPASVYPYPWESRQVRINTGKFQRLRPESYWCPEGGFVIASSEIWIRTEI